MKERFLNNLTPTEKSVFVRHLVYFTIEGILRGIFILNEFILLKSLNGSNLQVGLIFQFSTVVFIITLLVNQILKRYNKGKVLRLTAILTRSPLFLVAFFPTRNLAAGEEIFYHYFFLSVFFLYYLSTPVIFPVINYYLKKSYRPEMFGRLYGWSTSVNKVAWMSATFFFGLLLDFDNYAYTYIYPAVGGLGIFSIYLLASIDDGTVPPDRRRTIFEAAKDSVLRLIEIIKSNKAFRDFELGFLSYGFAFMATYAVISIFLSKELNLNYSSIGFYKTSYNIIAIMMMPYFGRLIGNLDPRKFAHFTFISLMLHVIFMALTEFFPHYFDFLGFKIYYMLILSYLSYSVFAATMSLLWNVGSSYFCRPEEASDYQSVHLTSVGLRGLFAPLIGIASLEILGYFGVFAIAALTLLAASLLMIWSVSKNKLPIPGN